MALMTGTKAGILWFGKELGLERDERGVEPWANGDESLRACRDEVRDDVIILPPLPSTFNRVVMLET
jgi:hypothetical protein